MDFKVEPKELEVNKSIQSESENNLKIEIKQEKEFLIENDFSCGEADEYYEDYGLITQQEGNIHLKIEDEFYNHENEYEDGYEYDQYIEDDSVDNYVDSSNDEEEEEDDDENSDNEYTNLAADCTKKTKNVSGSSKSTYLSLEEFITKNFMRRSCHLCTNIAISSYKWRKHLENDHLKFITEVEQYFENNGTKGICKECKQSVDRGYAQVMHNLEHLNIETIFCTICKYTASTPSFVKKHIVEAHTEIVEQFKITEYQGKLFKCPICNSNYKKFCQLVYHIKGEHPQEFSEKYTYTCHLCAQNPFLEKDAYLRHLLDDHELNSWETLDYARVSENKEQFACLKCFTIFVKNDPYTLLQHYLTHVADCRWNCGTCLKYLTASKKGFGHLCKKFVYLLKTRLEKENVSQELVKVKLENWQKFEEYIYHVCSFCNEQFNKTKKWQEHLKTVHEINTLTALNMKTIPGEVHKFCCTICHTMVVNTPVQLHAHCFQHLPYKPYKCMHCLQTLSTYKIAFNHYVSRCKNINSVIKTAAENFKNTQDIRASILIRCPLCDHLQFDNAKDVFKHFEGEHKYFEEYFSKGMNNSMTCKVCTKFFLKYDKNICLNHFHLHLDERAFKCRLCEKSFTTIKFCYTHLWYLHYAKPISENRASLMQEITKMSSALLSASADEEITKSMKSNLTCYNRRNSTLNEFNEYISYACPECNESMPSHKGWQDHVITKHDFFLESNLAMKDPDGNVKCPTCKIKLRVSMSSQQKHKLTHMPYRSFICNICYNRFNSLGLLYGHLRKHHFSPGSFKCLLCQEILKTAYERTEHLKANHPINEWPSNICVICYKVLSLKSLAGHKKVHDADRVKFSCDICGAKLLGKKNFQLHIERHQNKGEKRKLQNLDIETEQTISKLKKQASDTY